MAVLSCSEQSSELTRAMLDWQRVQEPQQIINWGESGKLLYIEYIFSSSSNIDQISSMQVLSIGRIL